MCAEKRRTAGRARQGKPRRASGRRPSAAEDLVFHPVDRSRWKDLDRLFEAPGGPKYCWCMAWRATPAEIERTDGGSRKAALARRVREGIPIGILGYLAGEPVAWCSIAPRATYRRLGGEALVGGPSERVWSLVCFFVKRQLRRQGIAPRLVTAAVEEARRNGATIVEAFPVDRDSPSYRFMGFTGLFEAAGFGEVGRAGSRRHVVQLRVAAAREQRPPARPS
jgi:GNAT superfamily N-acetyltransferase